MIPIPFLLRALPPDAAAFVTAANDAGPPDPTSLPGQFGLIGAILVPVIGGASWIFRRLWVANDATNAARLAEITASRDYERTRAERAEASRDAQNRLFQEQALGIMRDATHAIETDTRVLEGIERQRAIEKDRAERGAR